MKMKRWVIVLLLAAVAVSVAAYCVADEGNGHGKHRRESEQRKHRGGHGDGQVTQPRNTAYEASCGGCHWAYAPQLLPKASWANLLGSLGDHFGSAVELSGQEKATVSSYLLSNAADVSAMKISRKVMHSLGGTVPSRVVEVPYIQRKHRKLVPEVLARKSIGGLANCIACHPGATNLDFEDDRVRIPAS